MNKKGIIETAVIYTVIAILGGIFLWKPVTTALGISSPKTVKQSVKKAETKRPTVYFVDDVGKVTMGYSTTSTIETNSDSQETQLTLFQKIKNLGFIGIVLVILGFLFPPFGAILLFIWNKTSSVLTQKIEAIKNEKEDLSYDAKKIVLSIDEGLSSMDASIASAKTFEAKEALIDAKKNFLTAMSRKQDATTKLLVATLKND